LSEYTNLKVARSSGTTRLKMWAFKTLKNTISNILNDRFTHSFSLVTPVVTAVGEQYSPLQIKTEQGFKFILRSIDSKHSLSIYQLDRITKP
jgi:hypothetical protein